MDLYGRGRPADRVLNGGLVAQCKALNGDRRLGGWSRGAQWEEERLSGFREPFAGALFRPLAPESGAPMPYFSFFVFGGCECFAWTRLYDTVLH